MGSCSIPNSLRVEFPQSPQLYSIQNESMRFLFIDSQFEVALNKDQKITTNEPLSEADLGFLHCIFVSAHLNTTIVDLSRFDKEKIQGYAIVLKVIHGKNYSYEAFPNIKFLVTKWRVRRLRKYSSEIRKKISYVSFWPCESLDHLFI